MANVYIRSSAAGAGTGADWTNAYTTLAAALTAKAAGDSFYVSEDHNETQSANMILSSPGTSASPCFVYCVDHLGGVPPVSADLRTTGSISTTSTGAITMNGVVLYDGLKFNCGSGSSAVNFIISSQPDSYTLLRNCAISLANTTSGSATITLGSGNPGRALYTAWYNTTVSFGAAAQTIGLADCEYIWKNTASAIVGATLPTTLFNGFTNLEPGAAFLEGIDLSALSGKTLVGSGITAKQKYTFKDCKLPTSVTVSGIPSRPGGQETYLLRSDSSGTNYRTEKYHYTGTQTVETTIVRAGGASDGTTSVAWKIVTTANSKSILPFEAIPISIWNETTGSAITLTLEGIWGGGAVPTNANIWMDIEYFGSSGFPLGWFATSGPADTLAAGTNLASSSETWSGSTTKFKLVQTITPQLKGPITIYVKAALASSTFYIDPKVTVS